MRKLFLPCLAVVVAGCAAAAGPLLSPADQAFWYDQARRIVGTASLPAGAQSGRWRNETLYAVHVPGGNMGYPAFWVRDAVMMLGADFIPAAELEGWIRLIASTISTRNWAVREGVLVPAFAVPDHINFNGKPTYYPGSYETGAKQGGKPWGKYPPLDDAFYFLIAVSEHWRLTGDVALFASKVRIASGEMSLADLCQRVYAAAPVDPQTGLLVAGEVQTQNAKDFGFCDAESKSGKLLFPSILKFVAAGSLAELFRVYGRPEIARRYTQDRARLSREIPRAFFHPSPHTGEGWLHSATDVGNQPDVWGSAFALWSGAIQGPVARQVARGLVRAYRERTAVREGCVRQILTTDPANRGGWQVSVSRVGEYQNGGYWGTPAGWYISAIAGEDRQAAAAMARDFVTFLRNHKRPDGLAEAWEWFNPDTGRTANPLYVATVALPYVSLLRAGLLESPSR